MQSRGCQSGLREVIGQRDDAPLASRSSQRDISFTKRGVERASRTLRELRVVEVSGFSPSGNREGILEQQHAYGLAALAADNVSNKKICPLC